MLRLWHWEGWWPGAHPVPRGVDGSVQSPCLSDAGDNDSGTTGIMSRRAADVADLPRHGNRGAMGQAKRLDSDLRRTHSCPCGAYGIHGQQESDDGANHLSNHGCPRCPEREPVERFHSVGSLRHSLRRERWRERVWSPGRRLVGATRRNDAAHLARRQTTTGSQTGSSSHLRTLAQTLAAESEPAASACGVPNGLGAGDRALCTAREGTRSTRLSTLALPFS